MEFSNSWGIKLPKSLRPDGRNSYFSIRDIRCGVGLLKNANGSSYFSFGLTEVLCAVHGPKWITSNVSQSKVVIQIVIRPLIGMGSNIEKYIESCVKNMTNVLIDADRLVGSTIRIVVQIYHDDGGLVSAIQNSVMCALLHAGIPVQSTFLTVPIVARVSNGENNITNKYIIDPTLEEIQLSSSSIDIQSFFAFTVDVFKHNIIQVMPEVNHNYSNSLIEQSLPQSNSIVNPLLKTFETLAISLACANFMIKIIRDVIKEELTPVVSKMIKFNNEMVLE